MQSDDNRSSNAGVTACQASIGSPIVASGVSLPRGGGSAGQAAPPAGGGGYQNVCTKLDAPLGAQKIARDHRIDELRQIGLSRAWLDVANEVGYENFCRMWEVLDLHAQRDDQRLYIPRYSALTRYQRNRYIQSMAESGATAQDIRDRIKRELGENISPRHLLRIIGRDQ